jgi:vacuolar protein sorting-associated protein 11
MDETEEVMDEIQECLAIAKRQGVLPPVRIARILAGEHSGPFSCDKPSSQDSLANKKTVPLSVALDYIGTILDESRTEIIRLTNDVEEYNQLCNAMENQIDSLMRISGVLPASLPMSSAENPQTTKSLSDNRLNIDDLYAKIRNEDPDQFADRVIISEAKEAFWREINQSEDPFETISRFFAKGVIT